MTLDLLHADAVTDSEPAGLVTTGGTGSILHAVLAYREHGRGDRGITRPNFIKPETGHPAFDKACHLFGIELRKAPVDPETTQVDVDWVARPRSTTRPSPSSARPATTATAPSTRSRSCPSWRSSAASGCTSTAASAASSSRSARSSATTSRRSTSGCPASPASRPTPTSTATRSRARRCSRSATRRCATAQYFFLTDWTGGKYCSPGIEGSRSGGLLAATWAAMVQLGREGYLRYAKADLRDGRTRCRTRCARTPSCGSWASRRSASASRRDEFDIYHVNDFMRRARLAVQRPAVPERASTWRSPGRRPSPAWSRRSPPTSPTAVAYAKRARATRRPTARRDLRRRRRRHDRRGRRVHPGGHGRHARPTGPDPVVSPDDAGERPGRDAPPLRASARGPRGATLRPRGRPRHGRAEGRARLARRASSRGRTTCRCRDPLAPTAAAPCRTPGEWWTIVTDAVRKALASGDVPAERRGGRELHRPVGEHGARRRRRRAGRRLHHVDGHIAASGYARQRIGGPVAGYAPRALAVLGPADRRRAVARRRRPDRPHAHLATN